jgi:hypothetical protein
VRQKRGGNHHRTVRLKQVAVFAFSHTILSMSAPGQENCARVSCSTRKLHNILEIYSPS